jgi:hypothetical protein
MRAVTVPRDTDRLASTTACTEPKLRLTDVADTATGASIAVVVMRRG